MYTIRIYRRALAILLFFTCPVMAADSGTRGLAMADAMLNMMTNMGMLGQSDRRALQTDGGYPQRNVSPWQSTDGMPPGTFSPWSGMGRLPMPGTAQPRMNYPADPQAGRLDGFWQGRSGERLIIQENRFRLVVDEKRQMGGMLQQREHHLLLQARGASRPMLFEYALQQGQLVLRAADGNLYLYRRVNTGGNSRLQGIRSR